MIEKFYKFNSLEDEMLSTINVLIHIKQYVEKRQITDIGQLNTDMLHILFGETKVIEKYNFICKLLKLLETPNFFNILFNLIHFIFFLSCKNKEISSKCKLEIETDKIITILKNFFLNIKILNG